MGENQTKLSGPDLTEGVAMDAIADGAMLLGHANGEAVLLARIGAEVFAVGASCTHYGGPLAEGMLAGDTVRCPWHHACFSLRTGEAVRAPAHDPIACWKVERAGDRVVVKEKAKPSAPAKTPVESPSSVVIVGGGAAGHAAAEMLRREGYTGPVTLLSADPSEPVDRPNLSKDYLAGTAPEAWVRLRPREFYAEKNITLRTRTHVTEIDTRAKKVMLADKSSIPYGALLLATGADPIKLDVPGSELPHVRYLRTLADSRAIIEAAKTAKRAVIIGASFIGLEAAASLRTRGVEVHVVGPEARPLERVMGKVLGELVQKLHEEHGVVFHLEHEPRVVKTDAVVLDNGERLPADLVVVGVGVRPSLSLAEKAGLVVDRGIVVDAYLRTSTPFVWAAGDAVRWPDPHSGSKIRVEHWVVAQRQGQTAARNILGQKEKFEAVPFFWSQHYDVPITYVGHAENFDRVDVSGSVEGKDCSVAFRYGDKTLAVASIHRDKENLKAEMAFERGDYKALEVLVPPAKK